MGWSNGYENRNGSRFTKYRGVRELFMVNGMYRKINFFY